MERKGCGPLGWALGKGVFQASALPGPSFAPPPASGLGAARTWRQTREGVLCRRRWWAEKVDMAEVRGGERDVRSNTVPVRSGYSLPYPTSSSIRCLCLPCTHTSIIHPIPPHPTQPNSATHRVVSSITFSSCRFGFLHQARRSQR